MREILQQYKYQYRSLRLNFLLITIYFLTFGCTSTSGISSNVDADPLEPINRSIHQVNLVADKLILRPAAKGYDFVMPSFARKGIRNFIGNITYPIVFINSFLQGKIIQGVSGTGRFIINTSIGIGGLFDPATSMGLPAHKEDFGLTFARWGISSGPYIVVPLLGPRTIRSGIGTGADIQLNPLIKLNNNTSARDKLLILWTTDSRANLLPLDDQIDSAFDSYAFVRDAYLQNRRFLLNGAGEIDFEFDDGFNEEF
ncbi:MAG: VacJ family lipoprotein [Pseudomonadota bacterium]|nr:VacJ family lipoprotein [Pseudomonadota bacterium]